MALLVEVGHGRMTPAAARAALEVGDRSVLPFEAAPPHGLYLLKAGLGGLGGSARGFTWGFEACVGQRLGVCASHGEL